MVVVLLLLLLLLMSMVSGRGLGGGQVHVTARFLADRQLPGKRRRIIYSGISIVY